jgi:hypothetical protein
MVRSWGSALLVIVGAAASMATSPRREHASWELTTPAAEGSMIMLTVAEPRARRGAKVQVTQALVDHESWTGGTVEVRAQVQWIDPPADPRPARLAVDFVRLGLPESYTVRKEIEIGRKAAQPIELSQDLSLEHCVKGAGCTLPFEIRFEWVKPRGGVLQIVWRVDGKVGSLASEGMTTAPEGASIMITPTAPDEPNPFPASQP